MNTEQLTPEEVSVVSSEGNKKYLSMLTAVASLSPVFTADEKAKSRLIINIVKDSVTFTIGFKQSRGKFTVVADNKHSAIAATALAKELNSRYQEILSNEQ